MFDVEFQTIFNRRSIELLYEMLTCHFTGFSFHIDIVFSFFALCITWCGNNAVLEHAHRFVVCERKARIVIVPAVVRRSRSERKIFRTTRAKPASQRFAATYKQGNEPLNFLRVKVLQI